MPDASLRIRSDDGGYDSANRMVYGMSLDDYKVVLYGNQPGGWVAEVPAIRGCYALMPTREKALAELGDVFETIAAEYLEGPAPACG
jgi:predicted RNase H-like HicB family nuclease